MSTETIKAWIADRRRVRDVATRGPWHVTDLQGVSIWGQTQIMPAAISIEATSSWVV